MSFRYMWTSLDSAQLMLKGVSFLALFNWAKSWIKLINKGYFGIVFVLVLFCFVKKILKTETCLVRVVVYDF